MSRAPNKRERRRELVSHFLKSGTSADYAQAKLVILLDVVSALESIEAALWARIRGAKPEETPAEEPAE